MEDTPHIPHHTPLALQGKQDTWAKSLPDLINGNQEYEVEAINAHRRQGRSHLYLVKWKEYSTVENT